MFDIAYTLSTELGLLLSRSPLPVSLLTDSKSLFDIIHKGSRTAEKRLMIDIAIAREGYRLGQISDIGFIRSGQNLADHLTKRTDRTPLRTVLRKVYWHVKPVQFILRSD